MISAGRVDAVRRPGRRLGWTDELLAERLGRLSRTFDGRFLHSDPVEMVRRYPAGADREIVALLAGGLAYGRVASIRGSLDRLLERLGDSPSTLVRTALPEELLRRLEGFVHRFHGGRDVALFLSLVGQALRQRGTLEAFFLDGDPADAPNLAPAMASFVDRLFALDARPFHRDGRVPGSARARTLIASPASGSACKRHCLMLRWLVRPDDGVDCGVWSSVSPARLVVPLDTHVIRVARALGWTRRVAPSWSMAEEVSAHLRVLDPADPTRFDFALSRLGILGIVRARGGRLRLSDLQGCLAEAP